MVENEEEVKGDEEVEQQEEHVKKGGQCTKRRKGEKWRWIKKEGMR